MGQKKVSGQLGTIYNTNNFLAKGAPSKINLKCGRPSFPKSFSKYSPHAVTKTLLGGLTKNLIINLLTSRINHGICFEWSLYYIGSLLYEIFSLVLSMFHDEAISSQLWINQTTRINMMYRSFCLELLF